ncbi:hypothetical protein [Helicobacter sp. T3_23-1059]
MFYASCVNGFWRGGVLILGYFAEFLKFFARFWSFLEVFIKEWDFIQQKLCKHNNFLLIILTITQNKNNA